MTAKTAERAACVEEQIAGLSSHVDESTQSVGENLWAIFSLRRRTRYNAL